MLEHVSLPEAVSRALRHRILNNELPADTRLVEANLAGEFGVSRGTIRDAMRSLHAEGLIAIVPRRYSVVTRMSREDAEDVLYARYVLEDASIEGGLGRNRKDLVKSLRVALEHMSFAARTDDMDVVLEGNATQVTSEAVLQQIAEAYRAKYSWPVTVTGGAFDAPYGAPTAGPPPYLPYEITPSAVFAFGTAEGYGSRTTRYRF